jgi:pimeloyl-ACP methyl ester carboxylesterase
MPVVFIPRPGVDRRVRSKQYSAFASRHLVVRFDLRGFGRSMRAPGPYRYAEGLAALLDALRIERAALVTQGRGADIALEFALDHPERVTSLALEAPVVNGYIPSGIPLLDASLARMRAAKREPSRRKRFFKKLSAIWYARRMSKRQLSPSRRQRWRRRIAATRATVMSYQNLLRMLQDFLRWPRQEGRWVSPLDPAYSQWLPGWLTPPAFERLGEITTPTLIIVGEEAPPLAVEFAQVIARKIAGAEIQRVADASGNVHMEQPAVFTRLVEEFLERAIPHPRHRATPEDA